MPRSSAQVERERYAQRLFLACQAQPHRLLGDLSPEELLAMMVPDSRGGRSVGDGRKYREEDNRYLYVMSSQQRAHGIPPEQTLLELLGIARPTEPDGTTNADYARVLKYYKEHPELYRDIGLVLRWDENPGQLSVTPVTAADLPNLPEELTLDVDELLKQRPRARPQSVKAPGTH
jgi:hypothetical protein